MSSETRRSKLTVSLCLHGTSKHFYSKHFLEAFLSSKDKPSPQPNEKRITSCAKFQQFYWGLLFRYLRKRVRTHRHSLLLRMAKHWLGLDSCKQSIFVQTYWWKATRKNTGSTCKEALARKQMFKHLFDTVGFSSATSEVSRRRVVETKECPDCHDQVSLVLALNAMVPEHLSAAKIPPKDLKRCPSKIF